jgi:uncharacterized membrane protein SpoIIM required for sporulation
LYIAAVSDLSVMRPSESAQGLDPIALGYLTALVTRVHGIIYKRPPFRWASLWRFLSEGFPETFRGSAIYVALSAAIFLLFCFSGFLLGWNDLGFIELMVPEHVIAKVEEGQVWFNDLYTVAPLVSSWLMTHNISVTFLIGASGITFGVGTVYLLAINGLLLGTIAALCFIHGLSVDFWSFVLPHGTLELSALCMAGGAGLILGHALLDPGPHPRAEHLAIKAKDSGALAVGCVPLLVIAGVIEAFFSPAPVPAGVKFILAAFLFSCLVTYLCIAGKR